MRDVELYYSEYIYQSEGTAVLVKTEAKHVSKVMRHQINDEIYITDGKGCIYRCKIIGIEKEKVNCSIIEYENFDNPLKDIVFCFPRLKNNDRFDFALEKSIELGITNFIIFQSQRTIPKGNKIERWRKIVLSAMKQSLRSYLPEIKFVDSTKKLSEKDGAKLIIEQQGEQRYEEYHFMKSSNNRGKTLLIFGPEGGLNNEEIEMLSGENSTILKLTDNRLRSETAIMYAASLLASKFRV